MTKRLQLWLPEEDAELLRMATEGLSREDVCKKLNGSLGAVSLRAGKLGIKFARYRAGGLPRDPKKYVEVGEKP